MISIEARGREAGKAEAIRRMESWQAGRIAKKPSSRSWRAVARRVWYTTPEYQEQTGAYGDTGHNAWEYGFMCAYQEEVGL